MSLNRKGFVLIETLAVTVFAATIFVFLFKSVVPIMSIYDAKVDQIGNIDAVYNNYLVRKFLYNDEYYNNRGGGNQAAIKDADYTLIKCDNFAYKNYQFNNNGDRALFSHVYSEDYCNRLMETIGAREKGTNGSHTIDHYWLFYVKGNKIDNFVNDGLDAYTSSHYSGQTIDNSLHRTAYGTNFGKDTLKLLKDTVRDFKAGKTQNGVTFKETDSYLILYYWYLNPMYEEATDMMNPNATAENKKIEPKYKDAISILTIKSNSENLYCFKFQVVPDASKYFYENTGNQSKYYYFYDEKYTLAKSFNGDALDKCMRDMNGKKVDKLNEDCTTVMDGDNVVKEILGSTTVNKYCTCTRDANPTEFYKKYTGDSLTECTNYMKGREVSVNATNYNIDNQGFNNLGGSSYNVGNVALSEAEAKAYCQDLLRNHNQAYKIYTMNSDTRDNCKHYFRSYDTIKVRPTNNGRKGDYQTLTFGTNTTAINDFCNKTFNHYYLGTIWDDFTDARIGIPQYDFGEAELAIVDYDINCSKDVVIPKTAYNDLKVTVIGSHAFDNKKIRTVKFDGPIKVIDKDAFANNVYTLQPPQGALVVKN